MSFWEEASSATKGIVVVGGLLILVLGGMWAGGVGLFSNDIDGEAATQQRGLGAAAE